MSPNVITTEAIYDGGILRPTQPLPLQPQQRVNLIIQLPSSTRSWPENVAEVYQEIMEEEKRLAATMWPTVQETWPAHGDKP